MNQRNLIEPSSNKSPAWQEAHDGYETRIMSQMRSTLGDVQALASELDTAILSLSYRLRLEQENCDLRKLVNRLTGLEDAPILKEVPVVAETSGDIITDIIKAVATEMESAGGILTPREIGSPVFIEAVRRRLKERVRANPPPVPRELRK